jgi:hypothetical protein
MLKEERYKWFVGIKLLMFLGINFNKSYELTPKDTSIT